jgi:hypothetical protein
MMIRLVSTLSLVLVSAARLSAGPYDDMLKAVPPNTNTLVLVNVKAAYASPLGKSEKWADSYFHRYRAGIGFVPPDAEAVVVASEVNLTSMTRDHQIGLVKVQNLPNMRDLAARVGGSSDRLGDQVATLSPQDVYYIGLPGSILAGVYPANRQAATRWVKYATKSKTVDLAPYLKKAVEGAGDDVLTIAVDLTDSADQVLLKAALPASPAVVRQTGVNVDLVSKFVSSVQGLTFSVKVGDGIRGSVRLDFGQEIDLYKRITKELFLELLDYAGVAIPGMTGWEATYGERSMTLSGSLTATDLRRILSLFSFPGPTDEDDPKVNPGEVSVPATKRYLAAVDVILSDLRKAKDTPDYLKTATWNEKAAAQLDQLGRRAVDPIAITAAYDAAKRLRALAGSLRGVPIDLEAVGKEAYIFGSSNVGWGVGWWGVRPAWLGGGGSVQTNLPQVWKQQQKIVDDDKRKRAETWIQIDELLADARQRLTDKHKTRF